MNGVFPETLLQDKVIKVVPLWKSFIGCADLTTRQLRPLLLDRESHIWNDGWRRCIDPSENWVLEVRADKCLPPQDNTGTTTANLDPYVVYFKSNVIPGSSSEHENWKKKKKMEP